MEDYTRERRGVFYGLKVPFCLNALLISFAGMWVFILGINAMEKILHKTGIFLDILQSVVSIVFDKLPFLKPVFAPLGVTGVGGYVDGFDFYYLGTLFFLWFLICWGLFAGAINRVFALRISRDETMEFGRAVAFGFERWPVHVFSIIFIILVIIFFYFCNMVAGAIGSIPTVGPFLMIPFYILALISTLLITLLVVGLLFGWSLISSSVAVDGVDTFDAISRAYSYVFGRPWQVLIYHILPILFLVVFFIFAGFFMKHAILSPLSLGFWNDSWAPVAVHAAKVSMRPDLAAQIAKDYKRDYDNPYLPEKAELRQYLLAHNLLVETNKSADKIFPPGAFSNRKLEIVLKQSGHGVDNNGNLLEEAPLTLKVFEKADAELSRVTTIDSGLEVAGYIYGVIIWIATQLIFAFFIAYWLGSQTKAYFLLRHDVDGDDFEEMFVEEDEELDMEPPQAPAPAAEEAPAPAADAPEKKE
jgi:hypothetical protein